MLMEEGKDRKESMDGISQLLMDSVNECASSSKMMFVV